MRTLALLVPLLLLATACQGFSWVDQNSRNAVRGDGPLTVQDVNSLIQSYNTQQFYRQVRDRSNGRSAAFSRDMSSIRRTIDRHFFNYDWDDPYLNPAGGGQGLFGGNLGLITTAIVDSVIPVR